MAFSHLDSSRLKNKFDRNGAFTIQLALKPLRIDQNSFNIILTLHAGNDHKQLVIGQWRSYLIVMNGDDYAHRKNTKRISVELPASSSAEFLLTVTSSKEGTGIYFDDKPVRTNPDLELELPMDRQPILTLGNSVYGTNSWEGNISGLALFNRTLPPEEITTLHQSWVSSYSFAAAQASNPVLLYLFDERPGNIILDHATNAFHLKMPDKMPVLKKIILSKPLPDSGISRSLILDAFLNVLGFMPLGFSLSMFFFSGHGVRGRKSILLTVIFCFGVSLCIELLQAWIPTRSSQSLDLILNTLGALAGAFFIYSKKLNSYISLDGSPIQ